MPLGKRQVLSEQSYEAIRGVCLLREGQAMLRGCDRWTVCAAVWAQQKEVRWEEVHWKDPAEGPGGWRQAGRSGRGQLPSQHGPVTPR